MFRIGQFSTLSHTSVKTLRFYDGIGVLRPAHVDRSTNYRYYSAAQIADLVTIRRLRALGVSLSEIRDLTHDRSTSSRLHDVLLRKRAELVRQVREDERRLADLDSWVERIENGRRTSAAAVVLKEVAPTRIAVIREWIPAYSDAVGLFDELRHHERRRGSPSGARAAIWHTCGDAGGPIDCEAFVVMERPIPSTPRIRVCDMPAGLLATIVHMGRIDTSASPYDAARAWIASHGYSIVGPKREVYWAGSVDENTDADVTEIQFPIARV